MKEVTCIICGKPQTKFLHNLTKTKVYKCDSCNLYFTNNFVTDVTNIKEKYEKGHYWSDAEPEYRKKLLETDITNKTLAWISNYSYCKKYISTKKKLLEIGSGTGIGLIMFEKNGFSVTGLEPDPQNVHLINQKLKNGKCLQGTIEDFTTETKFDVIWLFHSFEHIGRPVLVLKKCKNLLDNDGILIIVIPDCGNQRTLESSIRNKYHVWHFTQNSIKKFVANFGFEILKSDSFATMTRIQRQIYKIIKKIHLNGLEKKFFPHYPFKLASKNDSYEIRLILKKYKKNI